MVGRLVFRLAQQLQLPRHSYHKATAWLQIEWWGGFMNCDVVLTHGKSALLLFSGAMRSLSFLYAKARAVPIKGIPTCHFAYQREEELEMRVFPSPCPPRLPGMPCGARRGGVEGRGLRFAAGGPCLSCVTGLGARHTPVAGFGGRRGGGSGRPRNSCGGRR